MRYTNLQAGRFLAAAGVVAFHAACHGRDILGVPSAFIDPVPAYYFRTAVVFFFALSGFVLAHALQTATLRAFLRSRLLRLYPAYWLAAAAVLVVRHATGNPVPSDAKGLLHAFALWPAGPNRSAYVLGVEWTLVYEVFLSLALIPFAAAGRKWGLGLGAAAWLAVVVGHQIAAGGATLTVFPKPADLPLSVVNAPFLLGVLAYFALPLFRRGAAAVPFLAAVPLAGGALFVETAPGWSLLLQAAGTALAVGAAAACRQLAPENGLVRAGDWSYGVYLAHVPVMTACFALVARHGVFPPSGAVVVFGGVLALAVSSGYGAFEWAVYRQLRTLGRRRTDAPNEVLPLAIPARRAA